MGSITVTNLFAKEIAMKLCTLAITLLLICLAVVPASAQQWRSDLDAGLQKQDSFEFKNIAVADAFRIVSQNADINIILDAPPTVDPTAKITFSAKDISITNALTWITRLASLEWCIQDEAVFVTSYQRLSDVARRQIETRNANTRVLAAKTWLPAMQEALAQKISISFAQKSLAECRDSLAILLKVNIIVSPAVDAKAPVTLLVSKMTAENVLSWITRKAGVDFIVLDQAVYISTAEDVRIRRAAGFDLSSYGRAHDLITFAFVDTPLDEALSSLAIKANVKIILRGASTPLPKVTLSGSDMALSAALQAILSKTGLNSVIIPEGDTIVVSMIKPSPAPPATLPAAPKVIDMTPAEPSKVKTPADEATTQLPDVAVTDSQMSK